jgi:hypothetical protein
MQQALEDAWARGYDPEGAAQLGGRRVHVTWLRSFLVLPDTTKCQNSAVQTRQPIKFLPPLIYNTVKHCWFIF